MIVPQTEQRGTANFIKFALNEQRQVTPITYQNCG
jgi:hypothetical protein